MSAELDWTDDEAVVRKAVPGCHLIRGAVCPVNAAIMSRGKCLHGMWRNGDEAAWKAARQHPAVQAYERAHNPAYQQADWQAARERVLAKWPDAYADKCVSWELWHIFANKEDTKGLSDSACADMTTEAAAWLDAASRLPAETPEAVAYRGKPCDRDIQDDDDPHSPGQAVAGSDTELCWACSGWGGRFGTCVSCGGSGLLPKGASKLAGVLRATAPVAPDHAEEFNEWFIDNVNQLRIKAEEDEEDDALTFSRAAWLACSARRAEGGK